QHKLDKIVVGCEGQLQRAAQESARLVQKGEQLSRERRQAEDERDSLERRQDEARSSIVQLEEQQRIADEQLTEAQRRLFEAREGGEDLSRRAAEAGAAHAALVERASALCAEVQRLEEASAELDQRSASLTAELADARGRIDGLRSTIVAG